MTGTHRAIVRSGPRLALGARPTVEPGPGELSVAVQVAGLCGTDIQMLRGLRGDPAPVIGHEGLATVVRAGAGSGFAPGTTVLINPTHPADPSFLLGHNVDGLFQERVLLPEAAVADGMVLPLGEGEIPEALLAALVEPLAVVHYALEIHRAYRPSRLVVVGDGTVGHLAVRAARRVLAPARIAHVHHTAAGLAWSRNSAVHADLLLLPGEIGALPPDEGTTCVVLATPRDATLPMLERVLELGGGPLVVDLVGGLPPGARTASLPGVDLAGVRAANCGGLPAEPVVTGVVTAAGRRVLLFGHRGVANGHLVAAARELTASPWHYRDLVTHETDLAGALGVLRAVAGSAERVIDGRRLVKLAIRVGATRRSGSGDVKEER
ncbi:alcohol dehydrogenase catalytic domain-containing protein [Nonomuraea sp. NPDC050790]|uniref:alcohol dehydrogenase catalytic domain-containing protein n=1 Tax=Nonomuraea sp. NPDC050790 TaxID=3364371 RepID=UPI00378B9F9B